MSRGYLRVVAASAVAGLLMGPVIGLQGASAAQFHVSAAPIQTWKVTHGLPELPAEPSADVADPSPETSSAPDVHGGDQDQADPAAGDPRPADDQGHADDQGGHSQAPSDDQDSSDPASGSEQPPGDDAGSAAADDGAAGVSEVTQDVTVP